jgi:CIC family chloride channel protein
MQFLFFGTLSGDLLSAGRALPVWERLILPAAGGAAAAALAALIARRGGGGGVAGIMEAVSLRKGGVVSLSAATGKAACSLFSIASGGSIGREGPIIQLASAVASRIGRSLRLTDERTRVLVACGAGAGFAAAYNTPIAAMFFVIEVVVGTVAVELLGPVAMSATIATLVTHAALGDGPLYHEKELRLASVLEMLPCCLLAIPSAILATTFLGSLDAAEWLFARNLRSKIVRGVAGGLGVGAIAIWLPHVYGNGYETTMAILDPERRPYGLEMLALLLAAKLVATASTVGSGGAGGVFTPTLLLGAALGAAMGDAAHALVPDHTAPPAAYALVGMAALLAATTHAPLLATMFVYEVTRDYDLILPLLLTSYVAVGLTRALRPQSIYEEEAERRGVNLDRNLEQRALKGVRASDILQPVTALSPALELPAVMEAFASTQATSLHVTDAEARFVGVIDLHLARERVVGGNGGGGVTAGSLARKVPTVSPDESGAAIVAALARAGRDEVPVVDPLGRLLGVVTRRKLAAAVDRDVIRKSLRVFDMDTRRIPLPVPLPPVKS